MVTGLPCVEGVKIRALATERWLACRCLAPRMAERRSAPSAGPWPTAPEAAVPGDQTSECAVWRTQRNVVDLTQPENVEESTGWARVPHQHGRAVGEPRSVTHSINLQDHWKGLETRRPSEVVRCESKAASGTNGREKYRREDFVTSVSRLKSVWPHRGDSAS